MTDPATNGAYRLPSQSPEEWLNSATDAEKDALMDEVVTRIVADLVEQSKSPSTPSPNAPSEEIP